MMYFCQFFIQKRQIVPRSIFSCKNLYVRLSDNFSGLRKLDKSPQPFLVLMPHNEISVFIGLRHLILFHIYIYKSKVCLLRRNFINYTSEYR